MNCTIKNSDIVNIGQVWLQIQIAQLFFIAYHSCIWMWLWMNIIYFFMAYHNCIGMWLRMNTIFFILHIIIALECDYKWLKYIIVIYLLSYILSEQENVGFLTYKPGFITREIKFVISSITMYNIWFLLWHILH